MKVQGEEVVAEKQTAQGNEAPMNVPPDVDLFMKKDGGTREWREQKTYDLTSSTDSTIDLANGQRNQYIEAVKISCPAVTGPISVTLYDGDIAVNGSEIMSAQYLVAMPVDGFEIKKRVRTGTLGIRISGRTGGDVNAYVDVVYRF
jgi:hypothetical protein